VAATYCIDYLGYCGVVYQLVYTVVRTLQWGCTSTYSKYHKPTFRPPGLNPHILDTLGFLLHLQVATYGLYLIQFTAVIVYLWDLNFAHSSTALRVRHL
jgi:hypothetical protein